MENEKEHAEKPREEGHNYVHTVPNLPWKEGKREGEGERTRLLTEQKFITKENCWFDKGTLAILIDDYRPFITSGLFSGFHEGRLDEEICSFDEFELKELTKAEFGLTWD